MRKFYSLIFFLCHAFLIMAQEGLPDIWINTKAGELYDGKLIEATSDYYIIRVDGVGDLTIYKLNIDWVSFTDRSSEWNRYKHLEESGASSYYIIPSGYNLKEGQFRYSNVMAFSNFFEYAVNDNFTIGGGLELFSVLSGESSSPGFGLWLKYSVPIIPDKLHGSVGTLFGLADVDGLTGGLIWYGMITYGSHRHNISIGPGYATDFNSLSRPVYVLSMKTHISDKLSLMSSNVLIPIDDSLGAFFSPGLRVNILGSTHFDIGALILLDEFGDVYGVPLVGFSVTPDKSKKSPIQRN